MSETTKQLRAHVRELGKQAEVVGALAKEFERDARIEVLVALKGKVAALQAAWEAAEAILSGSAKPE
jgi:hypothetical protein